MNSGIFWKTAKESAWTLASCTIGLIAFGVLFTYAMQEMGVQVLEFVSEMPWLTRLFEAAFGIDVSGEVSLTVLLSVSFTHGIVLMLTWTFVIATVTRTTVGEVERGTADILLTLPVSRSEIYISTSVVWALASIVLAFCPMVGVWLGTFFLSGEEEVTISRFFKPATNFLCLLLAVGGITSLISCIMNRRGPAIGIAVAILVISAALNFVEPFVTSIQRIRYIGLLNYFRPVDVVRLNQWPVTEMLVLLGIGFGCWIAGLIIFQRKDIPTA